MSNWRHILIQLAGLAKGRLNTLKQALSQHWGDAPTCIVAYHGYGTSDCLMLKGRVLEDRGIRPADATDSAWRNLRNMYRRFNSDAVPGARLIATIRQILDTYPALPFLLIGDSGQEDPEIYREVVRLYPNRILAMYIRNIRRSARRMSVIQALANEVAAAGSTLVLADDTAAAAQHAAMQGWIAPQERDTVVRASAAGQEAALPTAEARKVKARFSA